jgi:hypothetical protein
MFLFDDDLAIYPFEQFLEHFSVAFGFFFSLLHQNGAGMEAEHWISSLKTHTNTFYDWHERWRTGCISLNKRFENTLLASDQPIS